ncbi:MAG: 3-oxoadipate enol-lactonase [Limnohabitans sp.]|jgi:3-oxoadipate enol-lactonase
MAFVSVNGIDLHYTIDGTQGPWITLSHSLACNLSAWDAQAELLKKDFRVLRFDTRGHGLSSAPAGPYTLEELAADVAGLFRHLGITQTHWLGLSMGGMIGQTFALAYPSVFQSLILSDTTSRRPPQAAAMWGERIRMAQAQGMQGVLESTLARWFTPAYRQTHPQVMARIGKGILETPVEGFCGCCHAISKVDLLDRLHEIRCPTLIMVGEHDHGTPPEMSRLMHERMAGSEFVVIPDAGHIASIEQEALFNAAILKFLQAVA